MRDSAASTSVVRVGDESLRRFHLPALLDTAPEAVFEYLEDVPGEVGLHRFHAVSYGCGDAQDGGEYAEQ